MPKHRRSSQRWMHTPGEREVQGQRNQQILRIVRAVRAARKGTAGSRTLSKITLHGSFDRLVSSLAWMVGLQQQAIDQVSNESGIVEQHWLGCNIAYRVSYANRRAR